MDLNSFRLCSGLKVIGYFMILIVLAIVVLSYYAVVVLIWAPRLLDGGFTSFLSFTIIIIFHILGNNLRGVSDLEGLLTMKELTHPKNERDGNKGCLDECVHIRRDNIRNEDILGKVRLCYISINEMRASWLDNTPPDEQFQEPSGTVTTVEAPKHLAQCKAKMIGKSVLGEPAMTGKLNRIIYGKEAFNYAMGVIKLVMLMWSYIKVVIQDPGSVPENWKLVSEQNIEEGNSVALSDSASIENPTPTLSTEQIERRQSQSRGYCSKCQNGKPPRCRHCSVCQRCVLKMDHHCIWVVNCVGARNYKFFLLFVVYTFLITTLDTLVLLPSFIKFFRQTKDQSLLPGNIAVIFLVFVLNLAFSLSLLCFVIMHASLLSSNTTSVEVYEKKKSVQWKYDMGWKRNFEQVFGANKALWFFPLFSKRDMENIPALHGMEFPTRSDAVE
ncbi:hypothetical protein H5410_028443 [Solanum commersonii]|uniref:S-acyltransferase n=1 Tax=Solanum commersonii TaxID=4109 RepID=A0A9J5Z4Z0_SOLCO|nr:hypothetical protein H5410_028443 [Solanum commersonii]